MLDEAKQGSKLGLPIRMLHCATKQDQVAGFNLLEQRLDVGISKGYAREVARLDSKARFDELLADVQCNGPRRAVRGDVAHKHGALRLRRDFWVRADHSASVRCGKSCPPIVSRMLTTSLLGAQLVTAAVAARLRPAQYALSN